MNKTKEISITKKSAKWLIIVESPSKCRKIESFLGPNYCCIASKGHIRYISGLKSIDLTKNDEDFVKYDIIDEKKSHVLFLQKMVAEFPKQNILLATDDDREGEAIAWHICQVCKLDPVTTARIIFHEVTQPAVVNAVANPTRLNMSLVNAQRARQVLDILVGYRVSPLLWKLLYRDTANALSAGRCQTPALRLVYDNEQQSNEKKDTLEYKTVACFFADAPINHPVRSLHFVLHSTSSAASCKWENEEQVLAFLSESKTFAHKLKVHKSVPCKKSPPQPLNTSRLLQQVANQLHFSPQQTMAYCQRLYQEGWITYMRTESTKYSHVFLEEARKYIEARYGTNALYSLDMKSKIIEQQATDTNPHEAIRVTHIDAVEYSMDHANNDHDENDKKEKDANVQNMHRLMALYKFIWRTTVESCMSDAEYLNTKITISAPMNTEYVHTIEVPTYLGWKLVSESDKKNPNITGGILLYLTSISPTAKIRFETIECSVVSKRDHSHYSEATLIHQLEELGIGRPSTFATLVETIQTRGYVKCQDIEGAKIIVNEYVCDSASGIINTIPRERIFGAEKNKLVLQPLGKMTIEFLINHFDKLFSYDYSGKMEEDLDRISRTQHNSEIDQINLCKKCNDELSQWIAPLSRTSKETFRIKDQCPLTVVVFEKYGPVIRHTVSNKNNKKTYSFESIRHDLTLDLAKLKAGEYSLDELVSPVIVHNINETNNANEFPVRKDENKELLVKTGKYGDYVEWTSDNNTIERKSLKEFTGSKESIEDLLAFISKDEEDEEKKRNPNILRVLDENYSVRKGKTGPYIFYKTAKMHKPQFFNLKNFPMKELYTCSREFILGYIETKT